MKNILFTLALLVSFNSFSQDIYHQGSGIYMFEWKKGTAGWPASTSNKKKARQMVADYAKKNKADFEIISMNTPYSRTTRPIIQIRFKLVHNSTKVANSSSSTVVGQVGNESVIISGSTPNKTPEQIKSDAIKELKELKELLDMGIISQQEFDKKAEKLKKIILDN